MSGDTTEPDAAPAEENALLSLLSLPSDLLSLILSWVALADVGGVVRFGLTSRATLASVGDEKLARLCADVLVHYNRVTPMLIIAHTSIGGAPSRVVTPSLELLALHQAVEENVGSMIWLLFKPGTDELMPGEAPRLARVALLLQRFKGAKVEVEAHAAAEAPVATAEALSRNRAIAVVKELYGRCGQEDRLQARAWGRRHSVHWPPDETSARAEVYFALRESFVPHRPHDYTVREDAVQPLAMEEWLGEAMRSRPTGPRPVPRDGPNLPSGRKPCNLDMSRTGIAQMWRAEKLARAEKKREEERLKNSCASASTGTSTTPCASPAAAQPSEGAASSSGSSSVQDELATMRDRQREQLARAAEQRLRVR
tara:strand:+ start:56 stop:1162 length:1107 start_codon:yes stop_codon:yes gene_type:complete